MSELFTGATIKNISKTNIKTINIPIPSLGCQSEIIEYLDFIHKAINTSNKQIAELRQSNAYYLNHQAKFGKNEIKSLGEVCEFLSKSKRPASYGQESGEFPFYKSSLKLDSYASIADYNDESIIIGDGGEANINYNINFSASDHCYILQNKLKDIVMLKYIYYYIYYNLHLMSKLFTGATIKNISKTNIKIINIPIPELYYQAKIIDHCEKNDLLIAQLEDSIESNKTTAKEFLTMVISAAVGEEVAAVGEEVAAVGELAAVVDKEAAVAVEYKEEDK